MKHTGPKCKLCRREGVSLCGRPKCAVLRKNYPPGQHGKVIGKQSEFGKQLREKQKAKRMYGITDKVMRNYLKKAQKMKGNTGYNLVKLLNMRLDNILYLGGISPTRKAARQLINHGFFYLNKKAINIPSVQLSIGDKIELKKSDKKNTVFSYLSKAKDLSPRWLKTNYTEISCEIMDIPNEKELEANIFNPQLIVELYSR